MFWRKRKTSIEMPKPGTLSKLAGKLGVERRYALRILCPRESAGWLPVVSHGGRPLKLQDISEGGCCLIDADDVLGPSAGQEVDLVLSWPESSTSVRARIVSRVDLRLHIQFINLPAERVAMIKKTVVVGGRAQSVQRTLSAVRGGPALSAREVWTSINGDSVVIEDDVHRIAKIGIDAREFVFFRQAWPVNDRNQALSREEIGMICVFLCNIPQPSEILRALAAHIETLE